MRVILRSYYIPTKPRLKGGGSAEHVTPVTENWAMELGLRASGLRGYCPNSGKSNGPKDKMDN